MNKCSVLIFYNVHNKPISWSSLKSLLPKLNDLGYEKFLFEGPHEDEVISSLNDLTKSLHSNGNKENIEVVLNEVKKNLVYTSSKYDLTKQEIKDIPNIKSKEFPKLLKIINSHASGQPNGNKVEISGKKFAFPLGVKEMRGVPKKFHEELLKSLKEIGIKILDNQPEENDSMKLYTDLFLDCLMLGMDAKGVDVVNECEQRDTNCRDQFMSNKIKETCEKEEKIIFTVGASHDGIGKKLQSYPEVDLKQFFIKDYSYSDNNDVTNIQSRTGVTVIDARYENVVETVLAGLPSEDNEGEL